MAETLPLLRTRNLNLISWLREEKGMPPLPGYDGLSWPQIRSLEIRLDVQTVEMIEGMTDVELLAVPNWGRKSLALLREYCRAWRATEVEP